jgi:hypothetical protein
VALEPPTGGPFNFIASTQDQKVYADKFSASWNDIFSSVAPLMIDEASDQKIKTGLNNLISDRNIARLRKRPEFKQYQISEFHIKDDNFQTIKVQLRALGLITKSERARSVKDSGTYWALTPYGDAVMTRLRAIRRFRTDSPEK